MAKKTKAQKSPLHEHAALQVQEVIREVQAALRHAAYSLDFSTPREAASYLRLAKETLSRCQSNLRDLLEAQEHGSPPPQGKGAVPVGRDNVDGRRSRVSRSRASKRRVGSRKWVPCKSAWEDYRPWRDDPWKD